MAGINASLLANNKSPVTFPKESMIGSLMDFISNKNEIMSTRKKNKFQPMPPTFGLVPELNKKINDKKIRYKVYQERSLRTLHEFKKVLDSYLKNKYLFRLIKMNYALS